MPVTPAEVDHLLAWEAMGTRCRAWLVGPDASRAARGARSTVAHLEARWSRFLPSSDVSVLNGAEGAAAPVASETIVIVEAAVEWWRSTGGLFDPTVHAALVAAGYDRDRASGHGPIEIGEPAPGCEGIRIDRRHSTIQLPHGVAIDLGGIGKGQAADLIAEVLQHTEGGLIDLGGDLRVWGLSPDGGGWPVAIEDLRDGSTAALLGLAEGAVATSSTLRRRWVDGAREAHHLIDPRSGAPTEGDLVTVTVVAATTAAAEVLAKAALVTGSVPAATRLLDQHAVAGLLARRRGPTVPVGGFEDLCWIAPGAES